VTEQLAFHSNFRSAPQLTRAQRVVAAFSQVVNSAHYQFLARAGSPSTITGTSTLEIFSICLLIACMLQTT